MEPPYTIAGQVQLLDAATGAPVLVDSDKDGLVKASAISMSRIRQFIRRTHVPMFEVWCSPPSVIDSSINGGHYFLTDWQADPTTERTTSTPIPTIILRYYDDSGGALNRSTGVFTVPASGTYRHSMFLKVRNTSSNKGNVGIFLRVNGVRTLGNASANTADQAFDDPRSFCTEVYHEAGDQVSFQVSITNDAHCEGIWARWVVVCTARDDLL